MSKDPIAVLADLNKEFLDCRWDNLSEEFGRAAEKCESPIEQLLLAAMMNDVELLNGYTFVRIGTLEEMLLHRGSDTFIVPQAVVGRFRLDFVVGRWFPDLGLTKVAVECDGHDFHEKTKEQARRDKSRDRSLMADGWPVLRFTGSEIFKDPAECAFEVAGVLHERIMEKHKAFWEGGRK